MPFDQTDYQPSDPILTHLRKAKALIDSPDKWCQRIGTIEGRRCTGYAVMAARGIGHCNSIEYLALPERRYLNAAARELLPDGLPSDAMEPAVILNDRTDHATVMRMFDRAAELRMAELVENANV